MLIDVPAATCVVLRVTDAVKALKSLMVGGNTVSQPLPTLSIVILRSTGTQDVPKSIGVEATGCDNHRAPDLAVMLIAMERHSTNHWLPVSMCPIVTQHWVVV